MRLPTLLTATAIAVAGTAHAQEADAPIVVAAPGTTADADDAVAVDAAAITRAGHPDLLAALTREVAGVTLQDAQGNPWQPNLVYRGFSASPLQGLAQGLAVYLDGARFNQPFGDTVQFDLIPEAAIRRVTLLDANPVYGLNALGGAMVIETATGRDTPGLSLTGTGGRFGYAEGSAAAGLSSGPWSAFLAAQQRHDGGWRDFSPSTLYNGYADLGYDGPGGGLHVKLIGADSDLTGNGVVPVELYAARRDAVFTHPDNSHSRYWRISVHPWLRLGTHTRIEASAYEQFLLRRNLNGDAADIEDCDGGLLCLETVDGDAEAPLTDATGDPIAAVAGVEAYGVLNTGRERTRSRGILAQIVDTRPLGAGENMLAFGTSYDEARTRFDTATELGAIDETRGVAGLGPTIVQPDGAIAPVGLVTNSNSVGVFALDRLPIAPGLSAEIGVRWNRTRIELIDQIGTTLNGRHAFERVNPGIEFDWTLSPLLTLRAGYAETSRAPTAAELSCADENAPCSLTNFFVADPPLNQVVSRHWELGASGRRGGFHWLLSGYRATNADDIQYVASEIRGRAYFRNIGHTRRQGVEANLRYERAHWRIAASYAFIDATFRTPLTLSSPANPAAADDGTIAVEPGDRLPGLPRHSGTLSVDYTPRAWSLGGDLVARSGQRLVGDEGNDVAPLAGYLVANVRAGVAIADGLRLMVEVRNLFDRGYASFGTFSDIGEVAIAEVPGAADPRAIGPGSPRRWFVSLVATR
ncbi:TonB-dependent receptor [uncultured Sphingomonas sp.]|uniref:TonB-dependent receptor n=1 Tax=uncultured Sphingomonas sp. TaxID=158754 RepID=UPI0025FA2E61|nr:TonB-dependent receptor [uncultured Sphingomonas sp.]